MTFRIRPDDWPATVPPEDADAAPPRLSLAAACGVRYWARRVDKPSVQLAKATNWALLDDLPTPDGKPR